MGIGLITIENTAQFKMNDFTPASKIKQDERIVGLYPTAVTGGLEIAICSVRACEYQTSVLKLEEMMRDEPSFSEQHQRKINA